jgi:hypothetical protein
MAALAAAVRRHRRRRRLARPAGRRGPNPRPRPLPEWLPEAVAALCWLAVQPGSGRRERVVTFQSVLAAAFGHDLIEPTNTTAQYLSAVTGRVVTPAEVDSQLLNAVDYIDDALWCSRTAEELALEGLNLQTHPGAPRLRLDVRGITNPLLDPREFSL